MNQADIFSLACLQSSSDKDLYNDAVNALRAIEKNQQERGMQIRKTELQVAEPYINSGLAIPFALAIVRGVDYESVLDLWEAKWWKQYSPEDVLIASVLDGVHSEEDARKINEFRGEHPELSQAAIDKFVTVEWSEMLLNAGFEEHPEAVRDVLNGGDPIIIARIRGIEVEGATVPPPIMKRPPIVPEASKSDLQSNKSKELNFLIAGMNEERWANLFRTHLRGGALDNPVNRKRLRKIYGKNWINARSTKTDLRSWAKFFNISKRSRLSQDQLIKANRKKASMIRAFIRAEMA